MRFLFPKLAMRSLPELFLRAGFGALIAGFYGIVHDQITYSLSPEYFTKFKFEQFAYADLGMSPRWFVAAIGFLATWWVGLILGWILARLAILPDGRMLPRSVVLGRLAISLLVSATFGLAGFLYATLLPAQSGAMLVMPEVDDPYAFTQVGFIHLSAYLGGMVGTILSVVLIRRDARRLGEG